MIKRILQGLFLVILSSISQIVYSQSCNIASMTIEEGPICTATAEYGICVRITGTNLDLPPGDLMVTMNGIDVTSDITGIGVDGSDRIICISGITVHCPESVDLFVQWDTGCSVTEIDFFSTIDCGQEPCPYIPTLSQWGIFILGLLSLILGIVAIRQSNSQLDIF